LTDIVVPKEKEKILRESFKRKTGNTHQIVVE
jgi:hypothetical protein